MKWFGKSCLAVTLACASAWAQGVEIEDPSSWLVSSLEEWNKLLGQTNGWIGADGIFTIPLSGDDRLATAHSTTTLVVFSDTFVGQVDSGNRIVAWRMPHNTAAVLAGGTPDRAKLTYYWGTNADGSAKSLFEPSTPNAKGNEWYWLQDGIAISGRVFLTAARIAAVGEGYWGFAVTGVAMLVSAPGQPLNFAQYTQVDAPLLYDPIDGRGQIIIGAGILPNTAEAGAPFPDGYIYFYGTQNDFLNKKLVAARVLPHLIQDFSSWRYWDGAGWSTEIGDAVVLTDRVSSELSVTPLADGTYALVFQADTLGSNTAVRIGQSPVGPFGPLIPIWSAPERSDPALGTNILTYNAKAHPHLSEPGTLYITYNVGSTSGSETLANADVTRPRFIRAQISDMQKQQVNCGGGAVGAWGKDRNYSGKTIKYYVGRKIKNAGVVPQKVLRCIRGVFAPKILNYSFANVPPGPCIIRLYFADIYSTAKGMVRFHVDIEGVRVLSNFDVFAAAGGRDRALMREFSAEVDENGLQLKFTPKKGGAFINAIEIISSMQATDYSLSLRDFPIPEAWTSGNWDESHGGKNAVDGDISTAWIGNAGAKRWWLSLGYPRSMFASDVHILFDADSVKNTALLASRDGFEWFDLDEALPAGPCELQYLWIEFMPDEENAVRVPRVLEVDVK